MTDRLTQIDLLILMAEDSQAEGNDLRDEMFNKVTEHLNRAKATLTRLDKAREALIADIKDWNRFIPDRDQPMPRVVTQGPKQ